ncbi:MAG: hypothetical protein ABIQ90_03890, partial [Polaromonas sp.]
YWVAKQRTEFQWTRNIFLIGGGLITLGVLSMGTAMLSEMAGAAAGIIAAVFYGLFALVRLSHMANLGGPLKRLVGLSRQAMIKIGVWHG